jgi:hypothetical protein
VSERLQLFRHRKHSHTPISAPAEDQDLQIKITRVQDKCKTTTRSKLQLAFQFTTNLH